MDKITQDVYENQIKRKIAQYKNFSEQIKDFTLEKFVEV